MRGPKEKKEIGREKKGREKKEKEEVLPERAEYLKSINHSFHYGSFWDYKNKTSE